MESNEFLVKGYLPGGEPIDGSLQIQKRGAVLTQLCELSVSDSFEKAFTEFQAESPLELTDGHKDYVLLEPGRKLYSGSTTGISVVRRYYSLALIGKKQDSEADYTRIRGVQFAVEGFVDWMNQSAISISWDEPKDVSATHELNMKLQTPEVIFVVSDGRISTKPWWKVSPNERHGFLLESGVDANLAFEAGATWEEASRDWIMLQDVLCLIYGQLCELEIKAIDFEDINNPKEVVTFAAASKHYGRTSRDLRASSEDCGLPPYRFEDTDITKRDAFFNSYENWKRCIQIAVSNYYVQNQPVELDILTIAIALEALGNALARETSNTAELSFREKVGLIFEDLSYAPKAVIGDSEDVEAWLQLLTKSYNGIKHSKYGITKEEGLFELYEQANLLMRYWLANRLGVSKEHLEKRL